MTIWVLTDSQEDKDTSSQISLKVVKGQEIAQVSQEL